MTETLTQFKRRQPVMIDAVSSERLARTVDGLGGFRLGQWAKGAR